jgi:chemotaxis protein CheC
MPLLVDIRQLSVINAFVRRGATNVADAIQQLTGTPMQIDIRSLCFIDPADLPAQVGDDQTYVGTVQLTEPPYGVFMLTFSADTARDVAALLSNEPVTGSLSALHRSSLQELCNICTSEFIDGLANALETTIDMGAPELTKRHDGQIRDQVSHIEGEAVAIVLNSVVTVPERDRTLDLYAYLIPSPGSLVNLLDAIDAENDTPDYASGQTE